MSSSKLAAGLRQLHGQLAIQQRNVECDEQLLQAFTDRPNESAFAVLVRRHGPMVLHVCCRVLGREQDDEVAFQATFLVLARKVAAVLSKTKILAAALLIVSVLAGAGAWFGRTITTPQADESPAVSS